MKSEIFLMASLLFLSYVAVNITTVDFSSMNKQNTTVNYNPILVFEHDGCKIYSFEVKNRLNYFAKCNQQTKNISFPEKDINA